MSEEGGGGEKEGSFRGSGRSFLKVFRDLEQEQEEEGEEGTGEATRVVAWSWSRDARGKCGDGATWRRRRRHEEERVTTLPVLQPRTDRERTGGPTAGLR